MPESLWMRVSRNNRCPICDHDHWCGISHDGTHALCMRVDSDRKAKNGGHIHRVDGSPRPPARTAAQDAPKLTRAELKLLQRRHRADITGDRADRLGSKLGISANTLMSFGLGWSHEFDAFTFPMRDAMGEIVGFRTRHRDGSKRCITGSKLGLMTSDSIPVSTGWLLICEGESDAAAAVDLGFHAVGRPGCETCRSTIVEYVGQLRPDYVAIFADADPAGQKGAHELARILAARGRRVRVVTAPDGAKDLREWKCRPNSSHADLAALLESPAVQTIGGGR